jgi:microcystin-dependent protein
LAEELSLNNLQEQIDNIVVVSSGIPSGGIIMWSGSATAIPSGWTLCNGANGAPDLRNRFILGAGSTYAVGAVGGEETHKLTIDEMPSHSHSHLTGEACYGGYSSAGSSNAGYVPSTSVGGGQAHNNMPPYYALCFIMKL